MATMTTALLFLVLMACTVYCNAMSFRSQAAGCPVVERADGAVCGDTCNSNQDCQDGSWCCADACGSFSCVPVTAPCRENDQEYEHNDLMAVIENYAENKCGYCTCQNGEKVCHKYPCFGTFS